MKIFRNFSFFIIIILLCLTALSCFSPYVGEARLIISGAGANRALTQTQLEALSHTFTVTNEGGAEQTASGVKYGESVRFTLSPGVWDIKVDAFLEDKLTLSGSSLGVEVKAGVDTVISIELRPALSTELPREAGLYRQSASGYTLVEEVAADIEAGNFVRLFEYLNMKSDTYTLVLGQNYSVPSGAMSLKAGTLTLVSNDPSEAGMRELKVSGQGWLVEVGGNSFGKGHLILGKNVTLKGLAGPNAVDMNTDSLVRIGDKGLVTMKAGSVISNNTIRFSGRSAYGGGVNIAEGGELWMDGGEISGNEAKGVTTSTTYSMSGNGGGVYVDGGKFTMKGGFVRNNKASGEISGSNLSNPSSSAHGGGVYIAKNGTFLMQGGYIDDNTAVFGTRGYGGGVVVASNGGTFTMESGEIRRNKSAGGGGVYIQSAGIFKKDGGTIYGVNADGTANADGNTADTSLRGHAAYYATGTKRRDKTAGPGVNLYSDPMKPENWGE